jgi:hypothetical protein
MKRAALILIYWTILLTLRLSPLPGRSAPGRQADTPTQLNPFH